MNRFQHHPDGLVIVEFNGVLYMDTPENFALDSGVPYTGLPAGVVSLLYQPGRKAAYFNASGDQLPGPVDVAALDAALAAVGNLNAAKAARTAPPPPDLAAIAAAAALAALADIDLKSIRSIREYIAAKPDAPQRLKDYESSAAVERSKLI